MRQEQRFAHYDRDLGIEAYHLGGVVQKFPNHFHEYYVIGFIEGGRRHLWCKNREYDTAPGDLILFNPRDNHYCAPVNGEVLDYRAVNIPPAVMRRAAQEITGRDEAPYFTQNVAFQSDAAPAVGALYDAILRGAPELEKQEAFFYLLEQVLAEYAGPFEQAALPEQSAEIRALCAYMDEHYAENLTLDDLLAMTHFGKSYLLRLFARQVGVSPYRYLQTVRLDRAGRLLEQGVPPIEAAGLTGFSDQSHFTHYFKEFIGLTPKQYQKIFTEQNS
ncbi:MAG: AraC family transcriptional regulator [Eubacteriales bacterium]|nr:AraC family transcriptional regulator [Eubacteriales bacterium]